MNAGEERNKISQTITALKSELDALDINALSDYEAIQNHLDKIDAAYVQVKQFISRFGVNDWNSWGPAIWNYIERNETALKRKLAGKERDEMRKSNTFNKRMAYLSALFAAISAIAAVFSSYSGCSPSEKSKSENTIHPSSSRMTPNNAINSDSEKRRAFVAPLFTAGYVERWAP